MSLEASTGVRAGSQLRREEAWARSEKPLEAGASALAQCLAAGFVAQDVPVLQPVEPFLELSGEEIRRRLFLTSNEEGEELCLRPEFTIPAALHYLRSGPIGRRADWVLQGPVFRHRPQESGEFTQISAESIGRKDREAAEADILALCNDAIETENPGGAREIRLGDLSLFSGLLEALSLDAATKRRLSLALGEGRLGALLAAMAAPGAGPAPRGLARYSGVLDALKGADPAEARAFVKDLLSIAGIANTGGRSADDIAGRFLERARHEAKPLGQEQIALLQQFLAIEGDPDEVAGALRQLCGEAGLNLSERIDRFELRTGFFEARGLDPARLSASLGYARNLDYYSGFVFDIRRPGQARPVAAGGRYDRLFERLGHDVPAIGAAIWVERLVQGADLP